jgi:hypothetical protein
MADRNALRLAATLVATGAVLVTIIVKFLHPGGGATEEATLANFAASGDWTAIHLGQFVGMALILTGLLVLFLALNVSDGSARWVGFFGAVAAGVGLALAGGVFALDGVANKHAAVALASAPAADKAARFASAEALRWLEWGLTSYLDFMVGVALVLLATVIVWTARVPRPIGYVMGVSGLAYLVQGWVIGTSGFTSATALPTAAGYILLFAAMIWLLVVAWRMKVPVSAATRAHLISASM